jgi:type II secretory pathway pseudopilin PulG
MIILYLFYYVKINIWRVYTMFTNKGAMFGLDARIALAIFGALSVISGAALYSAIRDSKVTAAYTEMQEIVKASEQYLLDTGSYLPPISSSSQVLYSADLIENTQNAAGWKGPYLSYERLDATNFQTNFGGVKVRIYRYKKDGWNSDEKISPPLCDGTDACYEYLLVDGVDEDTSNYLKDLFNGMDEKFDNSDGPSAGIVRKRAYDATTNHNIYFQGVARPGQ